MAVGRMLDRVAFVAQHAQQFGDMGVVLDDQHAAEGSMGLGRWDSAIVANRRGRVITFLSLREDLDTAPGKNGVNRSQPPRKPP